MPHGGEGSAWNPAAGTDPQAAAMARARELADRAVLSDHYLFSLQRIFVQGEQPLPAIGVSLGAVTEADVPEVHVAYGTTVPGEGVRPVTFMKERPEGKHVQHGMALPMDHGARTDAVFRPDRADFDLLAVSDAAAASGEADLIFASWHSPAYGMPLPPFLTGEDEARREAARSTEVVRRLPDIWRRMHDRSEGQIRQHFIALGGPAIAASLDTLEARAAGDAEPPQPLVAMLATVRRDLGLTGER
jgi:hypothetical protein